MLATEESASFVDLPLKTLAALGKKLKKAGDDNQKWLLLEEVAGNHERNGELLWHLAKTGAYDAANDPELWPLLNEADEHASSADVLDLVANIEPATLTRTADDPAIITGWPEVIDDLVASAYDKDPVPWDKHWKKKVPKIMQAGFTTVLARWGKLDAVPSGFIRKLVDYLFVGGFLPKQIWWRRDGERVCVDLATEGHAWTPECYRFFELFTDREEWGKQVLAAHLRSVEADDLFTVIGLDDAIPHATPAELARILPAVSGCDFAYHILVDLRQDPPDALLALAAGLLKKDHPIPAEWCAVTAIRRLAAAGKPIPESVERFLSLRSPRGGSRGEPGVTELVDALRALPVARRRAVLERQFAEPFLSLNVFLGLPSLPELDLIDRAIALLRGKESYFAAEAWSLARCGVLPHLAKLHDAEKDRHLQATLRAAILFSLALEAEAGRVWEPAYDRFLDFEGWEEKGLIDHYFSSKVEKPLAEILAFLPVERAEAVLQRSLDAKLRRWPRVFSALTARPTKKVLERAFGLLVAERKKVVQPDADFVRDGILALWKKIGDDELLRWIKWMLARSGNDRVLVARLEKVVGDDMMERASG